VAVEIIRRLQSAPGYADLFEPPGDPVGPGFINVRVRDDALAAAVGRAVADERLGVTAVAEPQRVVVDFSSPNVAKPMHVGHIRSTVIGDAIARILRFRGHHVITDNHLGDWGTQFGMILWGWKHCRDDAAFAADPTAELGRLYRLVRKVADAKPEELAADPIAAALVLSLTLAACSSGMSLVQNKQRGYDISEDDVKQIRPGQSAALVTTVLGSPQSTNSFAKETAWIYIGEKVQQTAFGMELNKERTVLVVYFDKNNRVISAPGGQPPKYEGEQVGLLLQDQPVFRNVHDVCLDDVGDLYGCQWNADQVYPYKLHRV
jgi:outer membrane protein assembly factor BamE (lipoprotein component of BamABCDE complex)